MFFCYVKCLQSLSMMSQHLYLYRSYTMLYVISLFVNTIQCIKYHSITSTHSCHCSHLLFVSVSQSKRSISEYVNNASMRQQLDDVTKLFHLLHNVEVNIRGQQLYDVTKLYHLLHNIEVNIRGQQPYNVPKL